jgi:small subunit ribosomal protein S5
MDTDTRKRRGPGGPRGGDNGLGEEKQYDERTLHIDRVARVVKGGRRFRFRALVVVGDKKGRVGIGSAKGADVTSAVTKANDVAKKHFVKVSLYKGTLPHEAEAKVGGAHILIMPASSGTGLIAGGVIRSILEVAGVGNALSKSLGSSNKTNTAYATVAALDSLVPAEQWVTTKNKAKPTKKSPAKETEKEQPEAKVPKPAKKETKVKKEASK